MNAFDDLDLAMEDLEELLLDVLSSVLREDAMPCWDELQAGPVAQARLAIHDQTCDGHLGIMVRLGLPLARVLAGRMMTLDDPSGEDVLDAVAELANIAGGNVKSLLCRSGRLSLPSSEQVESDGAAVHGLQVRAVVLGQVVELTLRPGASVQGLLWPPQDAPEAVDAR